MIHPPALSRMAGNIASPETIRSSVIFNMSYDWEEDKNFASSLSTISFRYLYVLELGQHRSSKSQRLYRYASIFLALASAFLVFLPSSSIVTLTQFSYLVFLSLSSTISMMIGIASMTAVILKNVIANVFMESWVRL